MIILLTTEQVTAAKCLHPSRRDCKLILVFCAASWIYTPGLKVALSVSHLPPGSYAVEIAAA